MAPSPLLSSLGNANHWAAQLRQAGAKGPWPMAEDAPGWRAVPDATRRLVCDLAAEAIASPWPHLPATLWFSFRRVGNRESFETPYLERRRRLKLLALAAVFDPERFLDPLGDSLWSICEESSWCLPAHLRQKRDCQGLPDPEEATLDLFTAQTSADLSLAVQIHAAALRRISPLLVERTMACCRERCLEVFLQRSDYWWMGLVHPKPQLTNNWNPWIVSNVLHTALLVGESPERHASILEKALLVLDQYLGDMPDDGGCDEGVGYWNHAGGSLYEALAAADHATGGALRPVFQWPKVAAILSFPKHAWLGDGYWVNFADSSARASLPSWLVGRCAEALQDGTLSTLARALRQKEEALGGSVLRSSLHRTIGTLLEEPAQETGSPVVLDLPDSWLPHLEFRVVRPTNQGGGWTLAAKGGHNQESHNHNDVGSFHLYRHHRPVLIDPGVGVYTAQTFSAQRYGIWTMQSEWHNLPGPGGVPQSPGRAYRARQTRPVDAGGERGLSLEMAGAWPAEARLRQWVRTVVLTAQDTVSLIDRFATEVPLPFVDWYFVTAGRLILHPERQEVEMTEVDLPGGRKSGAARLAWGKHLSFEVSVEEKEIDDARMSLVWATPIRRLRLRLPNPPAELTVGFTLLPLEGSDPHEHPVAG